MKVAIKYTLAATAVAVLAACGGGGGGSAPPSPVIASQPISQTVYETQGYSFSVNASVAGGTVSYQWYKDGNIINNATQNTFSVSSAAFSDNNAKFSVKVLSSLNTQTTSTEGVLTVKQASPSISTNPTPQSIYSGTTAKFTVTADGLPPLKYQWLRNGVNITGATSSEYTTATLVNYNNGENYSVEVTNSRGDKITSTPATLTVNQQALGDLTISEISSCYYSYIDCWFEIYNPTTASIDLSNYKINVSSLVSGTRSSSQFSLPSINIAPGKYFIISSNYKQLPQRGSSLVYVGTSTQRPFWSGNGFVEITNATGNQTIDFVKFGTSTQVPVNAAQWKGGNVGALTNGESSYGYSIVRAYPIAADTDSSSDWTVANWSTPGGRNDVPANAQDSDDDGIPDSAEIAGGTFAGLDLYAMGARLGTKDIFVEVDHMRSVNSGILPRAESLQMIVNAFSKKGIALHFDAGTKFSSTFSPANFNLGQGDPQVPYEKCIHLNTGVCTENSTSRTTIYDWKSDYMDLARRSIFHYMVFGNSLKSDGSNGPSGIAELPGNDILISMGGTDYDISNPTGLNILINSQASTVMHELGHNLGLRHGGVDHVNYKANYYSVMNYLYQIAGLEANPNSATAYERWRQSKGDSSPSLCDMQNSVCGASSQFIIDYSNGSGTSLNEAALLELQNIGRGSASGAYADWNLNGSLNTISFSKDLNGDGLIQSYADYDDWSNLVFPFSRYYSNSGASLKTLRQYVPPANLIVNDRSTTVSDCKPLPKITINRK